MGCRKGVQTPGKEILNSVEKDRFLTVLNGKADAVDIELFVETKQRQLHSHDQWQDSKLSQGRFKLDIRKRFFTQRVTGHWNSLLWEVVTAPSLVQTEFKRYLDNTLRHMVWFLELDSMILIGPFQLSSTIPLISTTTEWSRFSDCWPSLFLKW